MTRFQDHALAAIARADIAVQPFPHFYVRDLLPRDTYAALLEGLPGDEAYDRYPPPYTARLFMNLNAANSRPLPPIWRKFERFINSQEFLDAMVAKFAAHLPAMAEFRRAQVNRAAPEGPVPVGCRTMLLRDAQDFALGPHTDAVTKFITGLYYMPADRRFAAFGTSIYAPKTPGLRAWKSPHYPHDQFDLVRTFPNVPNALFVFMKTDNSFHGVQPGDYPEGPRNLLMWVPEIGVRADKTWGALSVDRAAMGL